MSELMAEIDDKRRKRVYLTVALLVMVALGFFFGFIFLVATS